LTAAVRPAKPDDAAAVEQVRFASWQAAYGRLVPPEYLEQFDHAAAVTRWRDAIAIGARQAHVAELEGEIVGFCSYRPRRDDDLPAAAEIYAIYVLPEHWSTGIGQALLPPEVRYRLLH
jgi:GNAT superfamily N-acetyltransferase